MFILIASIGLRPPTTIAAKKHGSFEQPPTANQMYDLIKNLFKEHRKDLQKAGETQKKLRKGDLKIAGLKNFPVELEVASGSVTFDGKKYNYSLRLSSREKNTGYNIVLELDNHVYSPSEYFLGLDNDNGEKKVFCYAGSMDNIPVEIEETKGNTPIKITRRKRDIKTQDLNTACTRFIKVLTKVLNKLVFKS